MTTEESLLSQARLLRGSDRAAFLERECPDTILRARVEALLAAADESASNFDSFPDPANVTQSLSDPNATDAHVSSSSQTTDADHAADPDATRDYVCTNKTYANSRESDIISGRYRLLKTIGEGGMGSVYLAEQSEPVKRQVALKLIKLGVDSRSVLARFDAERQALAMMDHPNIARIYDGGVTERGQPFFVMELVQGVPLTDYCDSHQLSVASRLQLFVQVCNAVQHAHQKGIIHRDLKPGNVLVTEIDGHPVCKVIDFGVAKATEQKLTDLSLADEGVIVGTPAYMSPEQADPFCIDIDTRSDVYALGVILYELLTGSPPIDARQFRRGALLDMLRMVREVDALRPSTKLSTTEALPTIAANRATEPGKLTRLLRNELDWIVMKALEKDRDRRYDSANSFAVDVQRFLADEPVMARPPSHGYRLQKFVRRNRGPVIAVGVIALALVGGVIGTTFGLLEARKEAAAKEKARKAEAERADDLDRANDQIAYRLGVSNFLLAVAAFEAGDVVRTDEYLDAVPAAQRGWEWAYLKRQTVGGLFTLFGHTQLVRAAACSPDGTRLLTGSHDNTARLWDARTGTLLLTMNGHKAAVRAVAFSPDGKQMATASADRTARVWDAASGKQLFELKGHPHVVGSIAFSADGGRIATGCQDQKVRVFDAKSGEQVREFADLTEVKSSGESYSMPLVAFSPDGIRLLTACPHEMRVWDVRTSARLLTIADCDVRSMAFSPDGGRLVIGGGQGIAQVWDARTGKLLRELKGHSDFIAGVAFSPDGRRVATASFDRTARLWAADTGLQLREFKGHTQGLHAVGFTPDAARVFTAGEDQTLKVWDARLSTALIQLEEEAVGIEDVRFSSDALRVLVTGPDGPREYDAQTGSGVLKFNTNQMLFRSADSSATNYRVVGGAVTGDVPVWDSRTGKLLFTVPGHELGTSSVALSADGSGLATGGWDGRVKVWDGGTGAPRWETKADDQPLRTVCFSPDGTRLAGGGMGNTVWVWDAATGEKLLTLKGHTNIVRCVRFTRDGGRLVSGGTDGVALVWDAHTGEQVATLSKHPRGVTSVAFSPDGTRVITGSEDSTARVWDVRTGSPLLELKGHSGPVQTVALSPDGTRVVTGSADGSVRAWDAPAVAPAVVLKGHRGLVLAANFSADGARLVTGSLDSTARVWNTLTGASLHELRGHTRGVSTAALSPDGTRVATGGDATARVWDAGTGDLLFELKGHRGVVSRVLFSADGTRVVTFGSDRQTKIWDAQTGTERLGEPVPPVGWCSPVTPNGDRFAATQGERVTLVPLAVSADERGRRLRLSQPSLLHLRHGFETARAANDPFAVRFYLDRLIEYAEANNKPEAKKWRDERAKLPASKEVAPPSQQPR